MPAPARHRARIRAGDQVPLAARATEADIAAAAAILDRLNVSVDDLLASRRERPPSPTCTEYVPIVYAAMKPTRTHDNHLSYWKKIVKHWPNRRIDEPTPTELAQLINIIRSERSLRSTDRGGQGVARAATDALRCLYRHAERDRIIDIDDNPARQLDRAPQQKSSRRALPDTLLGQMYDVAADGSIYTIADIDEVAEALSWLTHERHPLAPE
ncbi:hypothetical protein [Nocardia terpenica]|uniref:Integrase n=1 Tax=Nocardia terpenica TaxID=455432 RepID=A0A164NV47_9NOCA|nr:hypothetical protein [Nocardia terpenica]KZM74766.1 hypothetical protein AWN90_22240 [Nocardia terpenica]NQE93609.1 hypothetical protein [Nocardia terpenica]